MGEVRCELTTVFLKTTGSGRPRYEQKVASSVPQVEREIGERQ
jgi:hypothetical protein